MHKRNKRFLIASQHMGKVSMDQKCSQFGVFNSRGVSGRMQEITSFKQQIPTSAQIKSRRGVLKPTTSKEQLGIKKIGMENWQNKIYYDGESTIGKEDNFRSTFFGNLEPGYRLAPSIGMSEEGFVSDIYKSKRSLVHSSSSGRAQQFMHRASRVPDITESNSKLSYHPEYIMSTNLPSKREAINMQKRRKTLNIQKRQKTQQQSRSRKPRQPKLFLKNKMSRKDLRKNLSSYPINQISKIAVDGYKMSTNPNMINEQEVHPRRIGTAQANRGRRHIFVKQEESVPEARKTISEKWLELGQKKHQHTSDLVKLLG